MKGLALLLTLTACNAVEPGTDMTAIEDLATTDLAGADLAGDFATAPDLAWTDLAGGVDIATPPDMTKPPDMVTPCGGPSEACCPGSLCNQTAATAYGWYGSVCNAGVCTHCGGIAGNPMGTGTGELCCDTAQSPAACIPSDTCQTTVDGPRCF